MNNEKVSERLYTFNKNTFFLIVFRIFPEISALFIHKPRGKESTEVRKSQIKGKESENSY